MKIFRLIGMLLIGSSTLFSCSNNEDELPPKEQEQTNQETYTISFNLGGEFISTSETPLSRTEVTPKKIYGINVYCKKDGDTNYQNYAYGLFDNIEDMTISLIGGYKYKFECSMVKNDTDTLYHDDNVYYAPFHMGYSSGYRGMILENKFNIEVRPTEYTPNIKGLKEGMTCTTRNDIHPSSSNQGQYAKVDRFYGELTDYIPTKDGVANIDLKRTAFGLKFIITPPTDGTLSIYNYLIESDSSIKVSANESTLEYSSMYTFKDVYKCWQTESYSQNFTIELRWARADGSLQTFEKIITAKRNVLTTINVNVNGSSTDSSLGINEDNTPMENENVDMSFDINGNNVNPNV